MKNYLVIDGKQIELSEESVRSIKKSIEPKYLSFVDDVKSSFRANPFAGEVKNSCQIGQAAVPTNMKGKCLVLKHDVHWDIIDNPADNSEYPQLLVATKK